MITLQKRADISRGWAYASPILAIILTLISGSLLFTALGVNPMTALHTFFILPIADTYGLSELLIKTTPILLCAFGLSLCYRAAVWNIGAEGQLMMGSLSATVIALVFVESGGAHSLPLAILAGMVGGALFAGFAAWLKVQFNANEILTTIMLNYIAYNLLQWAVHGPLRDPNGFNFPESALFHDDTLLPIIIEETRAHLGVLFTPLLMLITWVVLSKSFAGFQLDTLGLSPLSAKMAGFSSKKITVILLMISGATAGLAGAIEVTGPIGQLVPQVSPGYGFAAIIVAFLGRLHPVGILFSGLLMGILYLGGELVQLEMGLPKSITGIFQGLLLFYLLACDVFIQYRLTTREGGLLNLKKTKRVY